MAGFNNLETMKLEGHTIEFEARSGFWDHEYSLAVNGFKQDQIKGFLGQFYLRGHLDINGEKKPKTAQGIINISTNTMGVII